MVQRDIKSATVTE